MTLDTQLGRGYEGPYVYSGVRKDLEIMGPAFLRLSIGWVILTADRPAALAGRGHAAPARLDPARRAARRR